jgi:hypothetical protein
MKIKLLLAAVLLLGGLHHSTAAVINAASGSFSDVNIAVLKASPGDTVLIPAGTNSWTGTMVISGITLQGAGVNSTVILDETPIPPNGNGTPFLQIITTPAAVTRVTQIQFMHGNVNNIASNPNDYAGNVIVNGGGSNWRIDNSEFNLLTGKNILAYDDSFGLIDHNIFMTYNRIAVEVHGVGFGDPDWAAPTQFGSANAVYVEDNYFSDANNFGAIDISNGGRLVFRHNTMFGSYINTHGTETSQRYRSDRYIEVYNNNFNWGGGQQYNNFFTVCDIRGGSAVVFSNTAVGFWSMVTLDYYRGTDNDPNFLPYFGATGLRGWDSNGPALLTGTASVTSNALVVAGANWTSNQWVGCTVYNSNDQLCGLIGGNSANTIQIINSRTASLQVKFNAGDPFVIHHIYPMLDQPGTGQSDLLSGDSPNPVWLNEHVEPVYCWSNSLSLMYQVQTAAPSRAGTSYPNLIAGRDYINDVARPGYTPFTYPHPLTLLTNGVVTTNSIVNVPPPPTNAPPVLTPPTGLKAQGL